MVRPDHLHRLLSQDRPDSSRPRKHSRLPSRRRSRTLQSPSTVRPCPVTKIASPQPPDGPCTVQLTDCGDGQVIGTVEAVCIARKHDDFDPSNGSKHNVNTQPVVATAPTAEGRKAPPGQHAGLRCDSNRLASPAGGAMPVVRAESPCFVPLRHHATAQVTVYRDPVLGIPGGVQTSSGPADRCPEGQLGACQEETHT